MTRERNMLWISTTTMYYHKSLKSKSKSRSSKTAAKATAMSSSKFLSTTKHEELLLGHLLSLTTSACVDLMIHFTSTLLRCKRSLNLRVSGTDTHGLDI